jgi:hypothetical protein
VDENENTANSAKLELTLGEKLVIVYTLPAMPKGNAHTLLGPIKKDPQVIIGWETSKLT